MVKVHSFFVKPNPIVYNFKKLAVYIIVLFVFRIKEEPSEIHFPELDEIDEVNNAEQLLNLNGKL